MIRLQDIADMAGVSRTTCLLYTSAKGQFKVYFQPVVDAKTGKIASAESLIRWFHPKKGFISDVYKRQETSIMSIFMRIH